MGTLLLFLYLFIYLFLNNVVMELTRPSGLNQVTVVWNMDSITCITLLLIENLVYVSLSRCVSNLNK